MKLPQKIKSLIVLTMILFTTTNVNANEVSTYATNKELVGTDRYETAAKVSKEGWLTKSEEAIVVNSSAIVDALSVTPFAKLKDAPILLTQQNELNSTTKKELQRLGVKKVYVIGTEDVVSENVVKQIKSININTERIGGIDRFETALKIAEKINDINDVKEIAIVNGFKGLADAVSISSIAASKNMVIVPISENEAVKTFEKFIKNNNITKSYIIGTEDVVPKNIEKSVPNPERIGGIDRNETNAKIISKFYTSKELKNIYVAKNGINKEDELVDALSVGVLAAKEQSPVLIVGKKLDECQKKLFTEKKSQYITQVGNEGNENAFNELKQLQENKPITQTMYVYNADTLNVRTGPSTSYKIIGTLKKGQAVEVIEVLSNGWAKIKYNNDYAYVSYKYLSNTPVVETTQKPLPTPNQTPSYIDSPQDSRILSSSQDIYQNEIELKATYNAGLKSFSINKNSNFDIEYSAYYNNTWQLATNGISIGDGINTIEGIKINLKNAPKNYHIFYRVKDDRGWHAWVKDNKIAGEIGTLNKIKELQVRIVVSSEAEDMIKPTIAVDIGHNVPRPTLKGAINGIYDEDYLTKIIGEKVIYRLRALGYNVVDTLPRDKYTQTDELKRRAYVANLNEVDKFVSIHFNSADKTDKELGTEVLYSNKNSNSKQLAKNIVNKLCDEFGFINRGDKYRDNLYVLNNVNAPSVIVEGMFITSQGDMDKFISYGSNAYEKMAQAIVDGILK